MVHVLSVLAVLPLTKTSMRACAKCMRILVNVCECKHGEAKVILFTEKAEEIKCWLPIFDLGEI